MDQESTQHFKQRLQMQTKTLFSPHYLETRLPQHPEWADDPTPAFDTLRALWEKAQQFGATWSEAQTEDEFIKPALTALGWTFTVQPKSKHAGHVTRPDYALFADEAAQQDAYLHQGDDNAFYSHVLAIAEAKYWDRPLSQKDASGRETWKPGENPSHQMVSYLVGTCVSWGILTNGRVWRLYSREVSSTASEFYEVDLAEIMNDESANGDSSILDSFRRFWLFFRRDAFIPDAQGKHFVQRVHEGSLTYAREISDKLKELVYTEVMPEIAGGFIAYRREQMGIHTETEESLRDIYQASLSLLYKLLFLLYAEARSLLPVDNPGYREQSLTALAQWAADRRDRHLPLSTATHATPRYEALLALFHRIDRGDPSLNIPRYNGGLFNPQNPNNAFLERHRLSDRAVACAMDTLVRDAGQPVDYAYIDVRNLGAIYEGLLENKLQVSLQPSAVSGQPPYSVLPTPYSIQLVNDKGERKATGSYYTPDYIVKYIVHQTVGPILEARAAIFTAAMERVAEARRALERTADPGRTHLLRGRLDTAERDAREAFLGIKVLDPAMGSGHFLVNAVDFLTDGIIRQMQIFHDAHPAIPEDWNPIQQLVEQVRREILDEMARQGIAVEPRRLDDTALLTRLVMKRCIYGVDLNKMAVELAKLSLWLHSFTVGAPLSFLDHHLRWGNSLIGTDVRTVEAGIQVGKQQKTGLGEVSQFGLFAGPFAGLLDLTALMVEVVDRADATLSDVQQSAEDFEQFQHSLVPYKQALDLWVSRSFGNPEADDFLRLYGDAVLPALRGEKEVAERYKAAIARAHALWEERRFFHWDLEFPEVFVDLQKRDWAENPGFDAVIGNPPYGSTNALPWFPNLQNDVFVYFWKQGIDTTKADGYLSFITPAGWLTGINFQSLREILLNDGKILKVVGLPYDVFRGAYIDTCIVVIKTGESTSQVIEVKQMQKDDDATKIEELTYDTIEASLWYTDPYKKFILLPAVAKLQRFYSSPQFAPLGELIRVERGVQPYSQSKHTTEQIQSDFLRLYGTPTQEQQQVYLPELLGEELSRYRIESDANRWLKYSDELASKRDVDFFVRPRVVLRRLLSRRRELMAAVTSERFITTDNILNILIETKGISEYYIASLLNSKLIAWIYTNTSAISVKDDFPQVTYEELKKLPIPHIPFTTPAAERARLLAEAQTLAAAWVQQPDAATASYSAFLKWSTEYGVGSTEYEMGSGERHADVTHDLLASLAEEMLALNREKQAEMRGFLAWLERHIGAKVDALTGKSKLQNYLGDYQKGQPHLSFNDVLAILRQNRRKLAADPDARAFQETLEREYAASLARLLPLKQRLAATDRLIDLIVYRLYGLTEEEVGIVEG